MADLGTKLDLARSLFAPAPTQSTATIKGTVMADSSGGSVSVKIGEVEYDDDGNIIVPESDLIATIPIIGSASTGDEVTVIVEDGSPTAIAAPGWGDGIEEKTQHITFVSTGADAGLHIHEDASDYNTDGDLHLDSGGVEIRDSGTVLASFQASGLEFLQTIFLRVVTGIIGTSVFFGRKNNNDQTCGLQIDDRGQVSVSLVGDAINLDLPNATGIPGAALGCNGDYFFKWHEVTTATNKAAKTIDLTGASEVMVVANVTRNGAHHIFANTFPIAAIGNSAVEYKIGGYVGSSGTTGGAWVSMSLTSFQAVGCFINSVDMQSGSYSTQWTVYAR